MRVLTSCESASGSMHTLGCTGEVPDQGDQIGVLYRWPIWATRSKPPLSPVGRHAPIRQVALGFTHSSTTLPSSSHIIPHHRCQKHQNGTPGLAIQSRRSYRLLHDLRYSVLPRRRRPPSCAHSFRGVYLQPNQSIDQSGEVE